MNSYHINAYSRSIKNYITELNKVFSDAPIHEIVIAMSEYDDVGNYTLYGGNLNWQNKAVYDVIEKLRNGEFSYAVLNSSFKYNPVKKEIIYSSGARTYHKNIESNERKELIEYFENFISIYKNENLDEFTSSFTFQEILHYSELTKGRLRFAQLMRSMGDQVDKERFEYIMTILNQDTGKDSNMYVTNEDGEEIHVSYIIPHNSRYEFLIFGLLPEWVCNLNNIKLEIKNV